MAREFLWSLLAALPMLWPIAGRMAEASGPMSGRELLWVTVVSRFSIFRLLDTSP